MKKNLSYKKCDLNDLEVLTYISRQTFVAAFQKDNNPKDFKSYITSAFNTNQIKMELMNPHSAFYFVYVKEEIVGYFKINEKDAQSEPYGNEVLELSRIYVLEKFQGRQLGSAILEKIRSLANESHKSQIWLGVWHQNVNAVRFYEHHGFSKFDTHSFYIGNDKQTDWLMRLYLE